MAGMRVAILAALPSLEQNYSVCTVVMQQVKMLEEAGHQVDLFVKKGFNPKWGTLPNVQKLTLPGFQVADKQAAGRQMAKDFGGDVLQPYDAIFTHDFMFLPSFGGYREGVKILAAHEAANRRGRWFHWSHSVPRTLEPDHRGIPGHTYVSLAEEHNVAIARMYGIGMPEVVTVWNPIDVTETLSRPESGKLVRELRLMDTDILGVLPFPMGRMESKGVHRAVEYYIELAEHFRVKLLLCNARTVDAQQGKRRAKYQAQWEKAAAGKRFEFWFMSEVRPQWKRSTPNPIIRDLQRMSNLFVYPTIGEGNSLAIAEALTSGPMCVLPESRVAGMKEIADPGVFLCYWQTGHWKQKKFKHPRAVAAEILAFNGGQLGQKVHELRRRWRFSRTRIWDEQLKPALEARTNKRW